MPDIDRILDAIDAGLQEQHGYRSQSESCWRCNEPATTDVGLCADCAVELQADDAGPWPESIPGVPAPRHPEPAPSRWHRDDLADRTRLPPLDGGDPWRYARPPLNIGIRRDDALTARNDFRLFVEEFTWAERRTGTSAGPVAFDVTDPIRGHGTSLVIVDDPIYARPDPSVTEALRAWWSDPDVQAARHTVDDPRNAS